MSKYNANLLRSVARPRDFPPKVAPDVRRRMTPRDGLSSRRALRSVSRSNARRSIEDRLGGLSQSDLNKLTDGVAELSRSTAIRLVERRLGGWSDLARIIVDGYRRGFVDVGTINDLANAAIAAGYQVGVCQNPIASPTHVMYSSAVPGGTAANTLVGQANGCLQGQAVTGSLPYGSPNPSPTANVMQVRGVYNPVTQRAQMLLVVIGPFLQPINLSASRLAEFREWDVNTFPLPRYRYARRPRWMLDPLSTTDPVAAGARAVGDRVQTDGWDLSQPGSPRKYRVVTSFSSVRRPPKPPVRERKLRMAAGGVVRSILEFAGESKDIVDALWKALPRSAKSDSKLMQDRLRDLYNYLPRAGIDYWARAGSNLIANEAEDRFYGALGKLGAEAARRLGRGNAVTSGPAFKGVTVYAKPL